MSNYAEFTSRNAGYIDAAIQERIRTILVRLLSGQKVLAAPELIVHNIMGG